ncbi:hypothetical protein EUX98_g8718 [Antrodiella citrinella]|uniref:Uncharacterized protein n=1 Tax=Antrodiella citrinella TaxID=2447956 RepID=A0A4S4M3G9_9APHY|nr:hypothetical protein EUX98_g8718 [Antrodiella citrinella]
MSNMFSLRFPNDYPTSGHLASQLDNFPTCQVRPSHNYPFLLSPQEIEVTETLYSSERTAVYAATCKDGTELALKFTNLHDIAVESGVYDTLQELQGSVLPKLYGVFMGKDEEGGLVPCLVLERFGNRLECPFHELPKPEKAKLLNKVVTAHHAGLFHLDFAERNILVKDGDYRIIDLVHVEPHDPPCTWSYDFEEHLEDEEVDDMGPTVQCRSLKSWAEHMEFWDHGVVLVCRTLLIPKSDKLPPQHIMDHLITPIGVGMNTEYYSKDRKEIAVEYYTMIWEEMQSGMTLDEVEQQRKYFTYLAHTKWHAARNEVYVPWPSMDYRPRSASDESLLEDSD